MPTDRFIYFPRDKFPTIASVHAIAALYVGACGDVAYRAGSEAHFFDITLRGPYSEPTHTARSWEAGEPRVVEVYVGNATDAEAHVDVMTRGGDSFTAAVAIGLHEYLCRVLGGTMDGNVTLVSLVEAMPRCGVDGCDGIRTRVLRPAEGPLPSVPTRCDVHGVGDGWWDVWMAPTLRRVRRNS